MNLLYKILTRWSLGLCSLAVMGQPPPVREVSMKILTPSQLPVAPEVLVCPLCDPLRILPPGQLWRCEDNSHGPGSLGLKIPHTVDSYSVHS